MPKNEDFEAKAVDSSAISAWDPQVLSDMVDTAARRNVVMNEVLAEVHDRTNDAGSSFEVRERGTLDVQTQAEGSEISTEDLSYSTVEITVDKYGESVVVTTEAEEDGLDARQEDVAEELGVAFAESQDQTAYDTLVGNGSLETTQLNSAGQLTRDEIVDIRSDVRSNDYDPDYIIVHPSMEGEMLKIDNFVHADEYGDSRPVQQGEMGTVYGMTVLASTTADAQGSTGGSGTPQLVVIDSDAALHRVVKRNVTVKIDEEERNDQYVVVGTARWGHGVVNPEAAGILEN